MSAEPYRTQRSTRKPKRPKRRHLEVAKLFARHFELECASAFLEGRRERPTEDELNSRAWAVIDALPGLEEGLAELFDDLAFELGDGDLALELLEYAVAEIDPKAKTLQAGARGMIDLEAYFGGDRRLACHIVKGVLSHSRL